ncbi:MAG: hypothetical protein WCG25_02430 [bacterium]
MSAYSIAHVISDFARDIALFVYKSSVANHHASALSKYFKLSFRLFVLLSVIALRKFHCGLLLSMASNLSRHIPASAILFKLYISTQ